MAETTNNGGLELEEVELQGGVKVKLPKEQAATYRDARGKDKSEREQLAQAAGAARAEKEAAEAARQRAENEKQALEHVKNGEKDKAIELLTKETTAKVDRLASKYRDTHLRAAVANQPNLLKLPDAKAQASLVDDLAAQLRGSCRFDVESDTLVVIGADGRPALGHDGKPMQVDAWIAQHIESRPYLRQPTKAPGSGASGGATGNAGSVSITQAALDAMTPKAAGEFFAANPKAKVEG